MINLFAIDVRSAYRLIFLERNKHRPADCAFSLSALVTAFFRIRFVVESSDTFDDLITAVANTTPIVAALTNSANGR